MNEMTTRQWRTQVRATTELRDALQTIADRDDRSLNWVIVNMLKRAVEQDRTEQAAAAE